MQEALGSILAPKKKSQKKKEGMLPNSFYKASITLTTKQTNKKTKKKRK
jgi:hypothetical protein